MTRKIATLWLALILCMMYAVSVGAESRWMTEIKVSYSAVGSPGDAEGVFQLRGTTEDTPMPEGAVGHRLCVPAGETRSFGEIVFPGPGVYIYEVNRRNNPEGITARDSSVYRVTVVVRSDGDVQQVIETDGEKVTEIRYEDRYEKAALVETGDVKSLFLPGAGFLGALAALFCLRKNRRKRKKDCMRTLVGTLLLFTLFTIGAGVPTYGATKDLRVTYDRFQELPENYAKITGLPLQEAEITTTNGNIHKYNGYVGNNQTEKRDFVAYYGAVKFGTRNRNDTSNAVTKANEVKGNITLRWRNRAILSDNTKADVKVVVSGWTFSLGKNQNSKIGNDTKVYVPILQSSGPNSKATELCTASPRTKYSVNNGTTANSLAGACITTKCNVKIQILQSGTDTPVDEAKYPRLLFGFRDLDVEDTTIAKGKSAAERYNGPYAEGVELISGFESPVALAKKSDSNKAMQTLEKVMTVGENLRVCGDGAKMEAYNKATGTSGDNGTYYSGFISPVQPQGFSFKWTGSISISGKMMGTALWTQPEVAVKATRGEGGSIQKEGLTTYIINSSTTYDYTPAKGYRVKSLTVEGEPVDFNPAGGTYRFDRLYTSPVHPRSAKTGRELETKIYTIDVQFQRIEHKITTKVTGGTIDPDVVVGEGDNETIHYRPNDGYELEKVTVDGEAVNVKEYPNEYTFTDVQKDHHIEVVYRKIPVGTLTLRKEVTGALGDRSKKFEFQVSLSGLKPSAEYEADGIEAADTGELTEKGFSSDESGKADLRLKLKDDESAQFKELPAGTTYRITEAASDHIASYRQKATGEKPTHQAVQRENADAGKGLATEAEVLDEEDGDIEVIVTNNRPIATVTGVGNSDASYYAAGIVTLLLCGGWIFGVVLYKRKKYH